MKYIRRFRHSYQATQIQIPACEAMVLYLLKNGYNQGSSNLKHWSSLHYNYKDLELPFKLS